MNGIAVAPVKEHTRMKAVVYHRYGPPDVLRLQEVETPVITDDQVLIGVQAASVNPADWHLMRAQPFTARFEMGLRKPKHTILGVDVAGRVAAVGGNVTRFQPGDEVFGVTFQSGWGGFAEYVALAEDRVALKPANLTFEEAAAVPLAALTALQGLRDKGRIQAGQRVLINGASGGVGTFAVQLAKAFGAEVTGVCSARNLDMARSIGAEHVIDYTREDFTATGQTHDLIYCAVGNRAAREYRRALSPGGVCVVAGFTTMPHLLLRTALPGALLSMTGSRKVGFMGTVKPNGADLTRIADLIEAGAVTPVIDRRYPLSETAEAIRYLEGGHARGKVVIVVREQGSDAGEPCASR
ncbi:MAG TPA: NAD(P)-dependent alcohol dehydrogenase [Thermomicrobiales bacterium]|nr:NAD(P)-dependent alcohol dehydrogenase [Thermomicrobiales bacterium]